MPLAYHKPQTTNRSTRLAPHPRPFSQWEKGEKRIPSPDERGRQNFTESFHREPTGHGGLFLAGSHSGVFDPHRNHGLFVVQGSTIDRVRYFQPFDHPTEG
jgi:hypothetical protein